MKRFVIFTWLAVALLVSVFTISVDAQDKTKRSNSQEVSDSDGIPVLIKHLPEWQNVRDKTVFATDLAGVKAALGQRPVLDLIDFTAGTEAVMAPYQAGKLLIIEYSSPQLSIEADNNFKSFLGQQNDGRTTYKRIGNYNVFVFDANDEAAAAALIDQVKYEKNIQWLGEDPFLFHNLERAFVNQTSELFFSTVEVIVLGMGLSVIGGLIVGFIYFRIRERQRHTLKEFSDAGGMTRLNLDGLTPDISTNRLLNE